MESLSIFSWSLEKNSLELSTIKFISQRLLTKAIFVQSTNVDPCTRSRVDVIYYFDNVSHIICNICLNLYKKNFYSIDLEH